MSDMVHNNSQITYSFKYARNFLQTLAEIDQRINQLCSGLIKLGTDVSTIYKYKDVMTN